ncbi:MAG: DUF362 domain-containing protein [bacterium]
MCVLKNHNDLVHLSIEEIDERIKNGTLNEISRRDLIQKGMGILGGLTLASYFLTKTNPVFADIEWTGDTTKTGKSTVVQVSNEDSVDSTGEAIDGPVNEMLLRGISELTGENDPNRAWRKIASDGQRVGIKVNCIAGRGISTQVPLVMAIVTALKSSGVKERDILIWDRSDRELKHAGYSLSNGTDSLRCCGTKNYESNMNNINGTNFKLSTILTEEIDVLINVPVAKNHGTAGVTLSLKNHYGSHHNPGDHHANNCDPYIADICSHKTIREKTKLVVCDTLRAQCNGGPSNKPGFQWHPGTILMSFDPVAVDRIGSEIIDARRKETGIQPLGNSHRHITTAAKLGLGIDNLKQIDLRKVVVK